MPLIRRGQRDAVRGRAGRDGVAWLASTEPAPAWTSGTRPYATGGLAAPLLPSQSHRLPLAHRATDGSADQAGHLAAPAEVSRIKLGEVPAPPRFAGRRCGDADAGSTSSTMAAGRWLSGRGALVRRDLLPAGVSRSAGRGRLRGRRADVSAGATGMKTITTGLLLRALADLDRCSPATSASPETARA